MDWQMLIATGKDIILAGAAITGSVVAVKGLTTWRRQLKGQAEYELAKIILKSTFQYRDAIYRVRHPAIYNYEMPEPAEDQVKTMNNGQKRFYGTSKAYEARCENVDKIQQEIYTELLEAEALWGKQPEILFKSLFNLGKELFFYVSYYLKSINPDISIGEREAYEKIKREKRDILYDSMEDEDEFRKDVSSAINAIEDFLKPHLKR